MRALEAESWGGLLRARRAAHQLSRESLAVRGGRTAAQIAALEDGLEQMTEDDLEQFLAVLGEEMVLDETGGLAARARAHPYDAEQIERQVSLPIGERVALALAWNDFARQVSLGRHQPAPPQR
ncbi:MAG: helix-turn-helix domain-containing protein [Solirubrobacteraceae bacterium]